MNLAELERTYGDTDIRPYILAEGGALDVDRVHDCWERRAHIERYLFACRALKRMRVLDYGCGVGYGSEMLAVAGNTVFGFDTSIEAVCACLQRRRGVDGLVFGDILEGETLYSACTAFEVIEHLDDPALFLATVPATHLICSVPVIPTVGHNPHHRTDFTEESFVAMVERHFDIHWRFRQVRPFEYEATYLVLHGERKR